MDALSILSEYKKLVWPRLNSYLKDPKYPAVFSIPSKYKSDVNRAHWKIVKEYPQRKGKYLRPTILLLTAEALGSKTREALNSAAAIQISEEWLLIHDDFQDNSIYRRGFKTLHLLYGNELAVNAGDSLHVIMWKVILDNFRVFEKTKALKIANEFFQILSRTALGQAVEIDWIRRQKKHISDNDWYFIADSKSGYYSMAGPARLGGIIGDATEEQLGKLSKFGLHIGRCFQLVDDILDVTSDFSGLKERGNDIYEGKRTLILGHLLRTADSKDAKKIYNILQKGRDEKSKKEVEWIINKMNEYGSIDYGWKIAKKLKVESEKIFVEELTFLSHEPARSKIKVLIDFILERKH